MVLLCGASRGRCQTSRRDGDLRLFTGLSLRDFKFRCTQGGRFVTGEYRMSLWTKIYTGEMICLGVCRFRVV